MAGADPNLQTSIVDGDTWRQTALHLALLNKQVDILVVVEDGDTWRQAALRLAWFNKKVDILVVDIEVILGDKQFYI